MKAIVIVAAAVLALLGMSWFAFRRGTVAIGRPAHKPKWTLTVGRVGSPLAIDLDGRVLLLTTDGDLKAVSPQGTLLWTRNVGPAHRWAEAPTVAADGTIYVVVFAKLVVLNRNGSLRMESPMNTRAGGLGIALTDDRLYSACGRDDGVCAFTFEPVVEPVWRIESNNFGAPLVQRDGTVIVGGQTVLAIAGTPAPPRWSLPSATELAPDEEQPNSFAITNSGALNLRGLAAGSDGTTYAAWEQGLIAVNRNGEEQWRVNAAMNFGHQPVVAADGTIYFDTIPANFYAVGSDGKVRWKLETSGRTGQPLLGSSGTIYFVDLNKLRAVDPAGHEKWTAQLDDLGEASPTLSRDGVLYVVTQKGTLYAFPVGETLMRSSWPKFQGNVRNSGQADTE